MREPRTGPEIREVELMRSREVFKARKGRVESRPPSREGYRLGSPHPLCSAGNGLRWNRMEVVLHAQMLYASRMHFLLHETRPSAILSSTPLVEDQGFNSARLSETQLV